MAVALSSGARSTAIDLIWDEALAGHGTTATAGERLTAAATTAASAAASTDMASALTALTAIQAKTTNLPATPASSTSILTWAMSTDLATALTNITAIQAKTTNLPATPASSTSFLTWAMSTDLATALTNITAIQAKTTNLPATPASSTDAMRIATTGIDLIWDEAIAGHLTAGTVGAALNAAGSAGDPWATPVPGAYTTAQAGGLIPNKLDAIVAKTTNLPATPASSTSFLVWAMSTDLATALTNIAAIEAATTTLPASPASSTGFTGLMTSTGSTSIADGVWAAISESTQSYAEQIRNMRAALAGKATGGGTASISFRDVADTINRLTFTATTDGNRTAVTIVTT